MGDAENRPRRVHGIRTNQISALLLAALTFFAPSQEAAVLFTDPTAFNNALSGFTAITLDFEGVPVGTTIPSGTSVTGITFTYSISGLQLAVVDDFDTTSGTHSLGLDDPGNFHQFVSGDEFSLSFSPSHAIGLSFISTPDPHLAGDFRLITPIGTVLSQAAPITTLGDGGLVYFLGLVASPGDPGFTAAQIGFAPGAVGTFLFNVDDITIAAIPEPGSGILACIAFAVVAGLVRRRRDRS